MGFPEEEVLGADQGEFLCCSILQHIVPVPRKAALVDVMHQLSISLLNTALESALSSALASALASALDSALASVLSSALTCAEG
jgi:hypothetical protein